MRRLDNFLVNASNLHVGGGVQVAVSVIRQLSLLEEESADLTVFASTEVDRELRATDVCVNGFKEYRIINSNGMTPTAALGRRTRSRFSQMFTIFGPFYGLWPTQRTVVGFAQPWIIYPNNECYTKLSALQRLKTRLKYWLQGLFFRRADMLVVELEHVKEGLIRELGIKPERIHVVHNCLSSIYLDETAWLPVDVPQVNCDLRLGFLGRNYMHKNTAIFPAVADALETSHGIKTRFYVTFTDEEWKACSPQFRGVCINVGPLSVAQCPSFYKALDGVVFPSLLECFSATPLETMAMEKPLFASDRPFNRDVCHEHAHYFDPLAPASAARAIAQVFLKGGPKPDALRAAREHAINFSSPKQRAEQYLALLVEAANKSDIELKGI